MFRFVLICWMVLLNFSLSYPQTKLSTKLEKGLQIVQNAKQEIGIDKFDSKLNSIQIKLKKVSNLNGNIFSQNKTTNILLPDKILFKTTNLKPFELTNTSIWNGGKYKGTRESVSPDGRRTIKDISDRKLGVGLQKAIKDKKALENFKKILETNPLNKFKDEFWREIFPIVLINPFNTELKFNYIGQAESGDSLANVIDTKTESGHLLRLLFDSKTNRLLLMIEKYKNFDGDYENKYYYSNHEKINNVLIPKEIKVVHKFTPTGKPANLFYGYIDILDLKINPKFESDFFDVD